MRIPLTIVDDGGLWVAEAEQIQGLVVTGNTVDELLRELPQVAHALYNTCVEQGWAFVHGHPQLRLQDIVWVFELPKSLRYIDKVMS